MRHFRIVGAGRAGGSLTSALGMTGRWQLDRTLHHDEPLTGAARGVDLVVISTPDAAISGIAAAIEPAEAVVMHLAGSLGLGALSPHPAEQRAAMHPLVALPSPEVGAQRLSQGAWFAIAGHPFAQQLVRDLGGHSFTVTDENRAAYHAAACIASNHLVALLAQAGRVAAAAGVELEAYLDLVRATVDNVTELGPAAALTGPVSRGDWETIQAHRAAIGELGPEELGAYDAMVNLAKKLADEGDSGRSRPRPK